MFDWLKKILTKGETSTEQTAPAENKADNPKPADIAPAESASESKSNQTAEEKKPADHGNENNQNESKDQTSEQTAVCKTCGKPIPYNPSRRRAPKYCKACRKKYQQEHAKESAKDASVQAVKETQEAKPETNPELNPDQNGKSDGQKPKRVWRTCRTCGKRFTVPSSMKRKPNYCRSCFAKWKQENKSGS